MWSGPCMYDSFMVPVNIPWHCFSWKNNYHMLRFDWNLFPRIHLNKFATISLGVGKAMNGVSNLYLTQCWPKSTTPQGHNELNHLFLYWKKDIERADNKSRNIFFCGLSTEVQVDINLWGLIDHELALRDVYTWAGDGGVVAQRYYMNSQVPTMLLCLPLHIQGSQAVLPLVVSQGMTMTS